MLIIIPFWSSQLIRAYSWMNLLRDGGILDIALQHVHLSSGEGLGILFTQTAVIIGLVHIFCPYMIITIYMTLEKIDDSLLEASRSLGARPITTFRRVILPLTETGIISGAILVFVPCLGSFVEPRILGGTQGSVIGTVIEDQFFEIYGWNFGSAIAFLLLVMVLASMGILSALRKRGCVSMAKKLFGWIYTGLLLLFLYTPIIVLMVMSFNRSQYNALPIEFSLKWYKALAGNEKFFRQPSIASGSEPLRPYCR